MVIPAVSPQIANYPCISLMIPSCDFFLPTDLQPLARGSLAVSANIVCVCSV